MAKKVCLIFVAFLMLMSLTACGSEKSAEKGNAVKNTESPVVVNFDLTQYDDHGELSCGLIWVEKTKSSYDKAPEKIFAYLDTDGNVQSEWFSSEMFYPRDFANGMLILRKKPVEFRPSAYIDYGECIIYDTGFNELARGYFEFGDGEKPNMKELAILDANERGEIFAIKDLDDDGSAFVMIKEDGVVTFSVAEDAFINVSIDNLRKTRYENGYYIIDCRLAYNFPCYMGVFDEKGNCVFEPSEQIDYEVYSVKVLSPNEFEVMFEGKDGKMYTVTTDHTGKFLSEPK